MLRRVLGASAYGRLVKRYPFVKVLVVVVGAVRWFVGKRQKRIDRQRIVDVDLADDEILVLTRQKVRTTRRGDTSYV